MKKLFALIAMGIILFGVKNVAHAQSGDFDFKATSGDWSITVDPWADDEDDIAGLSEWIDPFGTNHIYQEWWWVRSNIPGESGMEESLDSLVFSDGFKPSSNEIALKYGKQSGDFSLDLSYFLDSSGYQSHILESLTITNHKDSPLELAIFGYTDFDLANTVENDTAFGNISEIKQTDATGPTRAEVTPTSLPDYFQIGEFATILNELEDNSVTTTLSNKESSFGPGDATFAFQWDLTILEGESATIEVVKTLTVTPEPISMILFPIGAGVFGFFRRRKLCKNFRR